jgi:hypothetical protein
MAKTLIEYYETPMVLKRSGENDFTLISRAPIFEGETIDVKTSIYEKNKFPHVVVEITECRPSKGVWEGEIPYVTICKLQKV